MVEKGNVIASMFLVLSLMGHAENSTPILTVQAPLGKVKAVTCAKGYAYMGGSFSGVGTFTGSGIVFDGKTLKRELPNLKIDGHILCSLSDGQGGWYIGGSFSQKLAHITENGSLDLSWEQTIKDIYSVHAIVIDSRGRLYVGGTDGYLKRFNTSKTRNGGMDLGWSQGLSKTIKALAFDSTGRLYVGGVGGILKRFNTNEGGDGGVDLGWNQDLTTDVRALAFDSDGRLYVGGFGGCLKRFNTNKGGDGGEAVRWSPDLRENVFSLVFDSIGRLYAGGTNGYLKRFNTIEGGDGKIDSDWNPKVSSEVYSLAIDESGFLFAGGSFPGSLKRLNINKGSEGGVDSLWNPSLEGYVWTLSFSSMGRLFAGGSIIGMDSLPVRNLARFNSNGTWDSAWNPKLYEGVSALDFGAFGGQFEISALAFDSHRNRLYVGMNDRLLFIDPDERGNVLKVSSLNEDIHFESEGEGDIDIISLAIDSSGRLYVGGQHDIEGGFLVRYNTNDEGDGKIDVNWGPEYGGDVSTLVFDSNGQLYVAGPSLRRFNTSPGGDDHIDKDWNPRSTNRIYVLLFDSIGRLYVGGSNYLRRFNTNKGGDGFEDATWNPVIKGYVGALAISNRYVYVGGYLDANGAFSKPVNLLRLSTYQKGSLNLIDAGWPPTTFMPINHMVLDSSGLLVMGEFPFLIETGDSDPPQQR